MTPKNALRWLLILLLVAALLALAWPGISPALALFADQQALQQWVIGFGAWGPLAVIGLHAVQILIAAIPGHLIMIACGYLYGFWGGFWLTWAVTVGLSQAAFWLARRGGRPVVERLVPPGALERWDGLAARFGVPFFMVSFMLPVFPADVMNYVAGLSSLPGGRFFVANLLGRLPGVVVLTLIGSHGLGFSPWVWIALIGGGLALLGLGRWGLARLEAPVQRHG